MIPNKYLVHSCLEGPESEIYYRGKGEFTVYGKSGRFYCTVFWQRSDIIVEPDKNKINVGGDGPYKYIIS